MNATHVRVTNGNDFAIPEMWDGVAYVFEPGEPRTIPLEAAALFFNFQVDEDGNVILGDESGVQFDRAYAERRWGWNFVQTEKGEELPHAMERVKARNKLWCDNIKIEPVYLALREVAAGEDDTTLRAPGQGGKVETPILPLGNKDPASKMKVG